MVLKAARKTRVEKIPVISFSLFSLAGFNLLVRDQKVAGRKDSARIVNIINSVRQCESRNVRITEEVLYQTVVEQVKLINEYHFQATFLICLQERNKIRRGKLT